MGAFYRDEAVKNWKKPSLIIGLCLFLVILTACALYARLIISPLDTYDLSPSSIPEKWIYQLESGDMLTPEEGRLPLLDQNRIVVCQLQITEKLSDIPMLAVNASSADCIFLLDGQTVYSPSGRYQEGRFTDTEYERGSASGQFTLHRMREGSDLTMIVQLPEGENRLSRLPKITLYASVLNYLSQYTSPVSENAMAAGLYFTIALIGAAIFLIGVWKGKKDAGLLITALCSLSIAFSHTNYFSHQTILLVQSPAVVWFYSTLPQVTMIWLLWYRLSTLLRKWALPVPGLITGWILFLLAAGFNNLSWNAYMNLTTAWILPGVFLGFFIMAMIDSTRKNGWYRVFFQYLLWSLPLVTLGAGLSAATGGKLAQEIENTWARAVSPDHSFYSACSLLCVWVFIICFIQAALALMDSIARRDAEIRSLSLREKYALENIAMLRQSQEETRSLRHEMQHHFVALRELVQTRQEERACEYINQFLKDISSIPQDSYSDHLLVNAIAGYYLNAAKSEGIQIYTDIRILDAPPLREEELCVMLTNVLENALEACRRMDKEQERYVSLTLSANQEHLVIICENSTKDESWLESDGEIISSKDDLLNHGYGIAAIRQIVERHSGWMNLSCQDGRFKADIAI